MKQPTKQQLQREANLSAWRKSVYDSALALWFGKDRETLLRIESVYLRHRDGCHTQMDSAEVQLKLDAIAKLLTTAAYT